MNPLKELELLSSDGIYRMSIIEWWLLKYSDEYKRIEEEELKRFMYFIDGKWVRLPDYFDARTSEEKFLTNYKNLNTLSSYHRNENYFKQEMAIYKRIKDNPQTLSKWLAKNEEFGAKKYICFSLDYFGDEDEMENEIHLKLLLLEDMIFVDRNDFKNTLKFLNIFNNIYWNLLEKT